MHFETTVKLCTNELNKSLNIKHIAIGLALEFKDLGFELLMGPDPTRAYF